MKPKARLIDPSKDPYDVLLDDYEKGMTAERIDDIFKEVGWVGGVGVSHIL